MAQSGQDELMPRPPCIPPESRALCLCAADILCTGCLLHIAPTPFWLHQFSWHQFTSCSTCSPTGLVLTQTAGSILGSRVADPDLEPSPPHKPSTSWLRAPPHTRHSTYLIHHPWYPLGMLTATRTDPWLAITSAEAYGHRLEMPYTPN